MLGLWHRRRTGFTDIHFPVPMDLRHLGAIRKGLAVTGNARLISVDHHRIPEDRSQLISVMAEGDHRPAFVSSELREREAIRYFEGVLVLRGNGALCLGRDCCGGGGSVEAGKVVDETCKLPGVVIGNARLPGTYACEANSVLYDPKQFRVAPVLHVG